MSHDAAGVVTKISPRSFTDTVARFEEIIAGKGLTLFAVIDQRAAAVGAALDLRDTTLILFGSPAAGTPVMDAVPLAGLDLPLKVLIWAADGQVNVSYTAPAEIGRRYDLTDDLTARLAAIGPLTDALVEP